MTKTQKLYSILIAEIPETGQGKLRVIKTFQCIPIQHKDEYLFTDVYNHKFWAYDYHILNDNLDENIIEKLTQKS